MTTWIIWIGFILFSANHDALNIYYNGVERKGNLKHRYRILLRILVGMLLINGGRDICLDFSFGLGLFVDAIPLYAFFWLAFDPLLSWRRMHYIEDFRPRDGIFYAGLDIWELGFMPWPLRYLFKAGLFIALLVWL